MTRIPYPDPQTRSEPQRAVLTSGKPVLNISRMAMHLKDPLWSGYRNFAIVARDAAPLDDGLREMVILRVGYLSNSAYELHHHLPVAVQAGVPDAKLKAVESGDFTALDPRERAVLDYASQVVTQVGADDATLKALQDWFSTEDIFGITILVCGYMTTARLIALGGVEAEEGHG